MLSHILAGHKGQEELYFGNNKECAALNNPMKAITDIFIVVDFCCQIQDDLKVHNKYC